MNVTCIVGIWLDDMFICRILFKQIETSGSGPAKKDKVIIILMFSCMHCVLQLYMYVLLLAYNKHRALCF